MARITLSRGYTVVPEGKDVLFTITNVKYDTDFGKLEVTCKTNNDETHTERYGFIKSNGETNDKALFAFSCFARAVLDDPDLEDVDEQELLNKKFYADVTHDEVARQDGNGTNIYSRLNNVKPYLITARPKAQPYQPSQAPQQPQSKPSSHNIDLDALLG